jgi:CheY-like chemotaxis protein
MKSICFVDDDKDEVRRFRETMSQRYIVGAGATLDEALDDIQNRRVGKPDLFLLDLYYGPHTEEAMRAKIAAADEKLSRMEAEVRALLTEAKQSPDGGFNLAEEAQKRYSGIPCVLFSRKAFLGDALRAYEKKLPILEKPDPDDNDKGSQSERYDSALRRHSDQIAMSLNKTINLNTWWVRNRQRVEGFSTGFFFFLLKIGLDVWKGAAHAVAAVIWIVSIAALVSAWFAKRS